MIDPRVSAGRSAPSSSEKVSSQNPRAAPKKTAFGSVSRLQVVGTEGVFGSQSAGVSLQGSGHLNLEVFLARHGTTFPVNSSPTNYLAGNLVTWRLPGNLPHIGIVSDQFVPGSQRPKIIHNIGAGPVEDDILFSYPISRHYRYGK